MIPAPGRPTALSAEELAASLRDGLDSRRHFRRSPFPPAPTFATRDDDGTFGVLLATVGFNAPAPVGGKPHARLKRLLARLVKKAIRPWRHQDRFNAAACDHLRHLHGYLGTFAGQTDALTAEVRADMARENLRVNELQFEMHQLRERLADLLDGRPKATTAAPVAGVEALFLHTRLPTPPARVMVVGGGSHALDLATLGFQVVAHGGPAGTHPGLRLSTPSADRRLPFEDGSFDVAVCLGTAPGSADRLELARVLAPTGTMIGSFPTAGAVDVATAATPFRPTEVVYAAPVGGGWSLTPAPPAGCEAVLWVGAKG